MGHKGDVENRYTTNKGRLPDSVVEDMREAYKKSQEYLQTIKVEKTSEDELKQAFRKQLLLVAGFRKDEVDKMDLFAMSDEEIQSIIRQRLLREKENDCKQKVITINEVERFLEKGWEYVATLPNKKVIIKFPR